MRNLENIFSFNRKYFYVSAALALPAVIFSSFLGVIISLLLLSAFLLLNRNGWQYPLFIIMLVALPGDINVEIRNFINIFIGFFLSYLFFKKYELDFSQYYKLDSTLTRLIILIISSLILSAILSKNIIVGIIEIFRQTVFFLIFYFLYTELMERKNVYNILVPLIFSGILVSFGILYELYSSGIELVYLELAGLGRSGGFYNNVSAVGGVLAISLPLSIAFLYLKNGKGRGIQSTLIILILAQSISLIATNSRAAIVSVVISLLVFSFYLVRKRIKIFFLTLSFTAVCILAFPAFTEILNLYFRTGRVFENTRYLLWDIALSVIPGNFYFGVGPGMFKYYIYPYLPVVLGSWEEHQIAFVYENSGAGHVHNFFLMRTSELGIVGLIVACMLLVYMIRTSYILMKVVHSTSREYFIISNIIFSIYIGLVVRSFFEATGILTNGWLSRDLPFWMLFIPVLIIKSKINERHNIGNNL